MASFRNYKLVIDEKTLGIKVVGFGTITDSTARYEAEKAGLYLIYNLKGVDDGIYIDTIENRRILRNNRRYVKMVNKWQSFGDVNFIEYGGTWIKRVGNCEYMVVKLIPLDESDNEWIFEAGTIYTDDVWVKKEEICKYQGVTYETDSVEYAECCVSYYGLHQFGGDLKRSDDIVGLLQELKDYEILTPIEVTRQMIEHLEGDKLEDNRHELLELLKEV